MKTSVEVRAEFAKAVRALGRLGFQFGTSGHLVARLPEPGRYLANPLDVPFSMLRPEDCAVVDAQGAQLSGPFEASGYAHYVKILEERRDVNFAFHMHTTKALAWSSMGQTLKSYTVATAELHALQSVKINDSSQAYAAPHKIIWEPHHAFVALGKTAAEAGFYVWATEQGAGENLRLLGTNAQEVPIAKRTIVPPELAERDFAIYMRESN